MWYFAPGEIFENMLQLKRIGLNFERILNKNSLHSYRNSDISSPRKCSVDWYASWCVLMYYFDQI